MTKITYIIVIAVLSMIAIPSAMAVAVDGLSVTRDISDQTVVPGSTFTVTVTLTANDDIWVPALDEDLPDGWTVTGVDCAGVPYFYKASTSEWILLCEMPAGNSTMITYNVTVPGDAALQDYDITGNAFAYHVDPVEVGGESTVTVEEYKALSVIRDISEQTVEQGSTFTVTVTLTANENIWVPALDEDLPDGWTVTDVDCPGAAYKASTTEWIWLCVLPAGESRTVIYDVTVPGDAALQDYDITGNAFAYNVDPINVSGESTVTVIAGEVEATDHVVINEFVANPSSGKDWVELYNPTGSDISLDGWALNDSKSQMKSLSGMINASEYRVFEVSTRLNQDEDTITLLDGTTVVDEVTYGSQPDNAPAPATGNSTGRCPNGEDTDNDADDFRIFEIPTGGIENVCV